MEDLNLTKQNVFMKNIQNDVKTYQSKNTRNTTLVEPS